MVAGYVVGLLRILGVHWSGCPTDSASSHLISTIVPLPNLVLPSCVTFTITFHHFCLRRVPPSRASPSVDFVVNHCIGFSSPAHPMVRHIHVASFFHAGNVFISLMHVLVWWLTHVSFLCLLKRNGRNIVLVSHTDPLQSPYGPCPVLTAKSTDRVDVVNQSLTRHFPRNVFASACQSVLPESFVCRLHVEHKLHPRIFNRGTGVARYRPEHDVKRLPRPSLFPCVMLKSVLLRLGHHDTHFTTTLTTHTSYTTHKPHRRTATTHTDPNHQTQTTNGDYNCKYF